MKFVCGQEVTLLTTEFKPVGTAVVCQYEQRSHRYEVDFVYPGNQYPEKIYVPEERLVAMNWPATSVSQPLRNFYQ